MKSILLTAAALLFGVTFAISTAQSQEPAFKYNGGPIQAGHGNHAFAYRKGMEGHWAQARKFLEDANFRASFEVNMNDADKQAVEAAVADIKSNMTTLKGYRSDFKMDREKFMAEHVVRDTGTIHQFMAKAKPLFQQIRVDHNTIMELLKKYRDAAVIHPVYPNPLHVGNTPPTISYTLKKESDVKITVSDANGRVVEEISKPLQTPGEHSITLGPNFTKAGSYYVTIETGSTKNTQKIMTVE